MNEREAIVFIMEEIKEQRRADHELYLDMRKQTTSTYERFLDRLRELDEREEVRNKPVLEIPMRTVTAVEPSNEELTELQGLFKTLPPARSSHMTQQEMRVDRFEPEEEQPRTQMSMDKVLPLITDYLKHADGSEPLRDIQYYVETELSYTWNNFSQVMNDVMKLEPRIQRSKVRGYYIFKEV